MSHAPHQTTPFRRPSDSWPHDHQPDPAEVGTAFGLELRLEDEQAASVKAKPADDAQPDTAVPPTLCP